MLSQGARWICATRSLRGVVVSGEERHQRGLGSLGRMHCVGSVTTNHRLAGPRPTSASRPARRLNGAMPWRRGHLGRRDQASAAAQDVQPVDRCAGRRPVPGTAYRRNRCGATQTQVAEVLVHEESSRPGPLCARVRSASADADGGGLMGRCDLEAPQQPLGEQQQEQPGSRVRGRRAARRGANACPRPPDGSCRTPWERTPRWCRCRPRPSQSNVRSPLAMPSAVAPGARSTRNFGVFDQRPAPRRGRLAEIACTSPPAGEATEDPLKQTRVAPSLLPVTATSAVRTPRPSSAGSRGSSGSATEMPAEA